MTWNHSFRAIDSMKDELQTNMSSKGTAGSAGARSLEPRTTHWTLHSAGRKLPPDTPSQLDQLPDVHGWLELREDELVGSSFRLAGLLPGLSEGDEGLTPCHLRFQGEVRRLEQGVLVADGQLGIGARLEPATARLRLGWFRRRDGAEWLDICFSVTSGNTPPDRLQVDLTAVRTRSVG